jgi:hypothetical protein
MLPNGIAGVEIHHEHRVLYKSLPEHHDLLYKCIFSKGRLCIFSEGRLNRIVRTEFFCRQSVMSFVDRREQLLAEAGKWVKGGACNIKESTICGEACHWSHQLSWKAGETCAFYRCVVPSALASFMIHVRTHVTRHTSWWATIDMCLFVFCWTRYQEKRGPCSRREE